MSGASSGRDDAGLRAAVRAGLEARDRAAGAPPFAGLWPADRARTTAYLRSAYAALAAAAVIAGLSWALLGRDAASDAGLQAATRLARELSAPGYWRVPTDDLLAFAAPPLRADLPAPGGLDISLEESLL